MLPKRRFDATRLRPPPQGRAGVAAALFPQLCGAQPQGRFLGPIAATQPAEGSTCAIRCQNNTSACPGGLSCPGRVKTRRRGSFARVGCRQVQRHRYAAAEAAPRRRRLRGTRRRFGVAGANPGCGFWGRLRADRRHLERGFCHGGASKTPPASRPWERRSPRRQSLLLRLFQAVAALPAFLSGTDVIFP